MIYSLILKILSSQRNGARFDDPFRMLGEYGTSLPPFAASLYLTEHGTVLAEKDAIALFSKKTVTGEDVTEE